MGRIPYMASLTGSTFKFIHMWQSDWTNPTKTKIIKTLHSLGMKSQWVRRGSEDKLILVKHYQDRQIGLHQNCKQCCEYQQARKQSLLYVLNPKLAHKSCVIKELASPVGKQHLWHKKKSQAQESIQRKAGNGQRASRKIPPIINRDWNSKTSQNHKCATISWQRQKLKLTHCW